MSRPTLPCAHVAKRFAFLFFLGAVLLVAEQTAGAQQPTKEPTELKLRWELDVKNPPLNVKLMFDREGGNVILENWVNVEAISFNARTGKRGSELPLIQASVYRIFMLEGGKVAYQTGNGVKTYTLWDIPSGKVTRPPYTIDAPRLLNLQLSANGRYTAASDAVYFVKQGDPYPESPLRIFDSKAGKIIISTDWKSGSVHFTPDASRVLTVDASDNFRWLKLPSGQVDGEWKFDRPPHMHNARIQSMSADGGVIVYSGTPPNHNNNLNGLYLLNGKTGEVMHKFTPGMYPEREAKISPEGDMIVVVRAESRPVFAGEVVEVLDTKGTLLAKIKAPANTPVAWSASWESRSLALYSSELKKLWMYDLPGASASGIVVSRPKGRDSGNDRLAIPTDAAVAKAEASIRQVLKDDYAKKTPAEQKAFAQKLIKLAGETMDDPVARFVMLRDARDFAQGAADPTTTLLAIDSLAKWYQFDGPAQQLASLEKILTATAVPATAKLIADAAIASAHAASDVDELDEAVEFAQLAAIAVKKAKLTTAAVEEADANLAQAKKARDAFATIRPALEKVKTMPDDPAANTVIGKYRCFIQSRWDDGLKHLSKGEDAALRAVAELDLKTPRTGAPEDSKLADAWWEYAQAAPADAQWPAQVRTRYWYGRCIPALTGLNKARAEGRVAITVAGVEYRPGLLCEFTAPKQPAILKGKKARIDATIDFAGGEFAEGTKQTDVIAKWTGALAPARGGRYTLVAQTNDPVRVKVDGKTVIDTTVGGAPKREFAVTLGEKVTPILVEYFALNADKYKLKLAWVAPGSAAEEVIPAECLFQTCSTKLDDAATCFIRSIYVI